MCSHSFQLLPNCCDICLMSFAMETRREYSSAAMVSLMSWSPTMDLSSPVQSLPSLQNSGSFKMSPHHPKSNWKAESAVKVVKSLFKKALKYNKDPWLRFLDYRNAPTAGIQFGPVQRLTSRRTKTSVPIATNLLYPEVLERVTDKIQQSYHDRNVKVLPDLNIGQEVQIAPIHRGKY